MGKRECFGRSAKQCKIKRAPQIIEYLIAAGYRNSRYLWNSQPVCLTSSATLVLNKKCWIL